MLLHIKQADRDVTDVVDVKVLVPVDSGGVNDALIVPSNISYKEFVNQVANLLEVAPKNVCIAYHFSTQPVQDKTFERIKGGLQFLQIMKAAKRDIEALVNSKAAKKKEFSIQLKDINAVAAGKKTKVKAKNPRKRVCDSHLLSLHKMIIGQKNDGMASESDVDATIDGIRTKSSEKLGLSQITAKLMQEAACSEHKGYCVKSTTPHPFSCCQRSINMGLVHGM